MRTIVVVSVSLLLAACATERTRTVEVHQNVPLQTVDENGQATHVKISTVSEETRPLHHRTKATVSHSRAPSIITLRDRKSARKVDLINPKGGKKMTVRDQQRVDIIKLKKN